MIKKQVLLGFDTDEIRSLVESNGYPAYRGNQIADWIYRKDAIDLLNINNIPVGMRIKFDSVYKIGLLETENIQKSKDNTFKLLLRLDDGGKIESVGLPYSDRFAACISSQIGCPVGCIFCATGRSGFKRNLTTAEIIGQILEVRKIIRDETTLLGSRSLNNIVFMGMGEPLLNYEAVLKSIKIINHELGIGARSITLSTIGYVPGIKKLMHEKLQITLAVSLHASTDELRARLIPGMVNWKIKEIIGVCREYFEQTGRRVTFEYCLLADVNDSTSQAIQLAKLLKNLNCHLNVIAYNPVNLVPFKKPRSNKVNDFIDIVKNEGITVTKRIEKGADIDAACGQLSLKSSH